MSASAFSSFDLDLRLVRSFTAVAEHRHFGRAAASLHVAQPSLSRQIQRLERQLGVRLLDRSPQDTRLTEAGQVFLIRAKDLLLNARDAAEGARAAARPESITVGYTGNLIVTPVVRELRRQYPEADIHARYVDWQEPHVALLDGRVDALVARMPFNAERLSITPLHEQPRLLMLPSFHRLAGRRSVTLADFADEPLVRSDDPLVDAFWRIDPRPDGRAAPDGPIARTLADKFESVAGGEALAIVPSGDQATALRQDLTTVPIDGIEPCQVALATRASERNPLVSAFRAAARTWSARPDRDVFAASTTRTPTPRTLGT